MNQSVSTNYTLITLETVRRIGLKQDQINLFITLFGSNGFMPLDKASIEKIYSYFDFGAMAKKLLTNEDYLEYWNVLQPCQRMFNEYAMRSPFFVDKEHYSQECCQWVKDNHESIYDKFILRVAKTFALFYRVQQIKKERAA